MRPRWLSLLHAIKAVHGRTFAVRSQTATLFGGYM